MASPIVTLTPAQIGRTFANRSAYDLSNFSHCLFRLETNDLAVPIQGGISPIFVLLTLVTNSMVCAVLVKKHMRSCTNAILVAMAVSDTLTGILPVPCFIYFYTTDRYLDYVPYDWCFAYFCLTDYVPTIFHTASIWLTVALAAQRYVHVCHPVRAKRLCTMSNVVKLVVGIYVIALVSQLCRFTEYQYYPVDVPSLVDPERVQTTCCYDLTPIVHEYQHLYFNMYYWFRVVFIHIFPCLLLVILNAGLVQTMRSAQQKRETLLQSNSRCYEYSAGCESSVATGVGGSYPAGRGSHEGASTTLMLVTVVGVFLLVEFPLMLFLIMMITENTFGVEILETETRVSASLILNLFILISYPVNFFIYCGMSRQFRNTFRALFVPRFQPDLETEVNNARQELYICMPQGKRSRTTSVRDAQL